MMTTAAPETTAPEPTADLVAPDRELFHQGHDPHDPRLGQKVQPGAGGESAFDLALLGCPQDEGIRRNRGRPGAASAPREIRRHLYRLSAPEGLGPGRMQDAGDVRIGPTLEQTHLRQQRVVSWLLRRARCLVVLGGGNDISHPDVAALAGTEPRLLAFNIDSHFDVRRAARPHSGTPYRQILEQALVAPGSLYQMGSKPGANSPAYSRYLEGKGVPVMTLDQIRRRGVERTFTGILQERSDAAAVFWGFDMDAVRACDAPGVSAGYPVGLTASEICSIAAVAGRDPRTRILEITECSPDLDIDGRTARLAAQMILAFLAVRFAGPGSRTAATRAV